MRYYWQVIARDEHGLFRTSPVWSFTTGDFPPSFWNIQTIINNNVYFPYLTLDPDNRPWIAFKDESYQDLKHTRYNGTTWQTEVVETNGDAGNFASIALDDMLRPHLTWDNYTTHNVRYALNDGLTWQFADLSISSWAKYISLFLDNFNYPHVAQVADSDDTIRYTWQDADGWHTEIVDQIYRDMWMDMAADAQFGPHIVYQSNLPTPNYLKYAWRDSSWHTETLSTSGYGQVAIAVDPTGAPHILRENETTGWLEHYWKTGGTWLTENVTLASYGPISFTFDQQGHPKFTYTLLNQEGTQVMYAFNNGGGWQIQRIAQGFAFLGGLALDRNGNPWIAYITTDTKALKLASPASLH
jgi:hypothetical protein